jgi:alkylation response protein AidB-like acyl-CoA dehydrogenase
VARARALAPAIAEYGPQIDRERELPAELVARLHDAELYRMLLPRSVGGGEIDLATFVAVMETIAGADASTAWCIGQASGCALSAAYLDLETARTIFGARDAVLAWGPAQPGATVRAVADEGGYRVTGTWTFASGSRHATWMGGITPVCERDGTPRLDAQGKPVMRTVLFPRAHATFSDVWQVSGLRGTGSDTYAVTDEFVPEAYAFARVVESLREPNRLYRFSTVNIHAFAFSAVALGIARATLDAFIGLAADKRAARGSGRPYRESTAIQQRIGYAEAKLRGARAFVFAALQRAWDAASEGGGPLPLDLRIEMRMATTYAIQQAREVVDAAYQSAGANAIFESGPFERRFRDLHAVTQQIQGHLDNFETVGAHLLGMPVQLNL